MNEFRARAAAKRHFFALYSARRGTARSRDRAFMQTGRKLEVRHGDEQLEVRCWGDGEPILLVHGAYASGGAFRMFAPELARRGFRAIAFDAPGHGASPGTFVYGDEMSDAILSVQNEVGPLAGLVGHSLGASWSINALRGGLRCKRMVCISPLADTRMVLDIYVRRNGVDPEVAAHLSRLVEGFNPSAASSPTRIVAGLDLPGLVIHDEDDPLAAIDGGRTLAEAWPGCRSLWTQGLGHLGVLRDRQVLEAAASFLNGSLGAAA